MAAGIEAHNLAAKLIFLCGFVRRRPRAAREQQAERHDGNRQALNR
jgi:hypothetical protein